MRQRRGTRTYLHLCNVNPIMLVVIGPVLTICLPASISCPYVDLCICLCPFYDHIWRSLSDCPYSLSILTLLVGIPDDQMYRHLVWLKDYELTDLLSVWVIMTSLSWFVECDCWLQNVRRKSVTCVTWGRSFDNNLATLGRNQCVESWMYHVWRHWLGYKVLDVPCMETLVGL